MKKYLGSIVVFILFVSGFSFVKANVSDDLMHFSPSTTSSMSNNLSITPSKTLSKDSATLTKPVSLGAKSLDVKELQKVLVDKGVLTSDMVTGNFGPMTLTALGNLQQLSNIPVKTVVDNDLLNQLKTLTPVSIDMVTHPTFFGVSDPFVKKVQLALVEKGFLDKKNATGYHGELTDKAAKAWQKKAGLPQDGFIDVYTLELLNKYSPNSTVSFTGANLSNIQTVSNSTSSTTLTNTSNTNSSTSTTSTPATVNGLPNIADCSQPTIELPGIIRDFPFSYDGFNFVLGMCGISPLFNAENGRPQISHYPKLNSEWFVDVPGLNQSKPLSLKLTKDSKYNQYTFEAKPFLPINGQLLDDGEDRDNKKFTYEAHGMFTYVNPSMKPKMISVETTAMAFVFLNNKLAISVLHPDGKKHS